MILSIRAMFHSTSTYFDRSNTYADVFASSRRTLASLCLGVLLLLSPAFVMAQTPVDLSGLPNAFYSRHVITGGFQYPFGQEKALCAGALMNPESMAAIVGEQIYVQPRDASAVATQQFVIKALADTCRMSLEARRYLGEKLPELATGQAKAPDEPKAVTDALQAARSSTAQIAAFIKEADHNFYSAEQITREIPVYNDSARGIKIILGMEIRAGRRLAQSVKTYLTLAPGEPARYLLRVKIPKVAARKNVTLTITAGEPDSQRQSTYTNQYTVRPIPKGSPCKGARLAGYRLNPAIRRAFARWNVKWSQVPDLTRITHARYDVLLIGSGALPGMGRQPQTPDGVTNPQLESVERFVESGGRVIVLEQASYRGTLFGVNLKTRNNGITTAFNAATHHAIMRALSDNDMRYWRGDNRVARAPFVKPSDGSAMALAECGDAVGLDLTPLLLIRRGRGAALLCQMLVGEKCGREPAADVLLRSMLKFASTKSKTAPRRTAILAKPTSAAYKFLNGLGLAAENVDGTLSVGWLGRFGCIIADASDPEMVEQMVAEAGRLEGFMKDGGVLVLHDLQPGDEELVNGLTGTLIEQANITATSCAWKSLPLAVLDGVSNYDLFLARYEDGKLIPVRQVVKAGWKVKSGMGMNLIEPAGLLRIPYGKGQFLLDNVLWDGDDVFTAKRSRYISALLRNLGAEFETK